MTRNNTIVQNSASIPENCQNRSYPTAMFDTAGFFDLEGSALFRFTMEGFALSGLGQEKKQHQRTLLFQNLASIHKNLKNALAEV